MSKDFPLLASPATAHVQLANMPDCTLLGMRINSNNLACGNGRYVFATLGEKSRYRTA